jgi:hypothetical protein
LGNHDDRAHAEAAMTRRAGDQQPVVNKLVTTIDAGPIRFIMLDSLLATNIAPGQLGRAQRDWLAGYLDSNRAKNTVVFVHHNPDPESDTALVDATRLMELLKARAWVKALIFGHTHVYAIEKQDGLHLINLPAVGYNFADGQPIGWMTAEFSPERVRLQLHAIGGEMMMGGQISNLAWR